MARTTPVARYCRKPGRQPAGPHLSLRLTLCQHGDILPPNEGIKALYMSRIILFHKTMCERSLTNSKTLRKPRHTIRIDSEEEESTL
ncbi:hypothetical protein PIB30_093186, partial [Stylosanthes scabra]|nr:hypothetical protein [Stylosanthes scabra]